jgi:hypothetical protein
MCIILTEVVQLLRPGKQIIVKSVGYDLKSTWGIVIEK